jgi:hypothetical protein
MSPAAEDERAQAEPAPHVNGGQHEAPQEPEQAPQEAAQAEGEAPKRPRRRRTKQAAPVAEAAAD